MWKKSNFFSRVTQFSFSIMIVIACSLLLFSIAQAVTRTMSIGDFTDWASVPAFQTDPTGSSDNLSAGATSNEDITITKVATSTDNYIYFYVESLGSPLFGGATQLRQAVAELDCDRDGNPNETTDMKINFGIQGNVLYCSGDRGASGGAGCAWTNLFNDYYKSGNAVEWRFKISDSNTEVPQLYSNCRADININFALIEISQFGQVLQTYDNTTNSNYPWRGWNVPTNVGINQFQIRQSSSIQPMFVIFSVGMLMLIGLGGFRLFRKNKR